jgi:glyoxylate reductase
MKRVYVSRTLPAACMERLRAEAEVTLPSPEGPRSEAELLEVLPGHDVAVVQLTEPITAAVLDRASPTLRLVAQVAVGLDNVDLGAARRFGVAVSHTPGVLTDATADFAFALILASARRVVEGDRYVRSGAWTHWSLDLLTGLELRGATLGIIGLGRIGAAVARRALPFGLRVVYTQRNRATELEEEFGAHRLPLDELLATSDIVSVHAPLTDATRHLLDRRRLGLLKPGAILVNTARGPIVDEAALVDALEAGRLRGAALDVFEGEPAVHAGLLGREDVVLAPHLGSATEATRLRMATMATDSALAALRGESVPHLAPQAR